jgi:hypothetical protein
MAKRVEAKAASDAPEDESAPYIPLAPNGVSGVGAWLHHPEVDVERTPNVLHHAGYPRDAAGLCDATWRRAGSPLRGSQKTALAITLCAAIAPITASKWPVRVPLKIVCPRDSGRTSPRSTGDDSDRSRLLRRSGARGPTRSGIRFSWVPPSSSQPYEGPSP